MSYVFNAQQQAEIAVLVTDIQALEILVVTQQATYDALSADWQTLKSYVQNQKNQTIWDDTIIIPESGLTAWGEESAKRIVINQIIATYSIPQLWLPDLLCGITLVYMNRAAGIRDLIFDPVVESDLNTTKTSITEKKAELLQYYEFLTLIDL